jgi:cytochrome c peroxidase
VSEFPAQIGEFAINYTIQQFRRAMKEKKGSHLFSHKTCASIHSGENIIHLKIHDMSDIT